MDSISTSLGMFDFVKHINDVFAIVKHKVLYQVVGIFEIRSVRPTETAILCAKALANSLLIMLLEKVGFALVCKLQVISNGGKVIQYDLDVAVLVAVVFGTILLEVWWENRIDWIFAHNAAKVHKKSDTQ